MAKWDEVFPQYGLKNHKGYATPEHRRALLECGPTSLHRFSYEPVRNSDGPEQSELFGETESGVWI
jgi:ribonuclease HII